MVSYHIWKLYTYNTDQSSLSIIDSNKLPVDFDLIKNNPKYNLQSPYENFEIIGKYFEEEGCLTQFIYGDEYGRCAVIVKIDNKELQEIRIVGCHGLSDLDDSKLFSNSIEDGFLDEGYTVLKEDYKANLTIETGEITFINYIDHFSYDDEKPFGIRVLSTKEKNNKDLENIVSNHGDYEVEFLEYDKDGFSFNWDKGEYEIINVIVEKERNVLSHKEVMIEFPCCNKKTPFELKYLKQRWGVLNLHCEECDKYQVKFDQFLKHNNQPIDFDTTGITGYKEFAERLPYGTIVRPIKNKEKIKFMFQDTENFQ